MALEKARAWTKAQVKQAVSHLLGCLYFQRPPCHRFLNLRPSLLHYYRVSSIFTITRTIFCFSIWGFSFYRFFTIFLIFRLLEINLPRHAVFGTTGISPSKDVKSSPQELPLPCLSCQQLFFEDFFFHFKLNILIKIVFFNSSFEIFLLGALAGLFLPKLLEQIAAVRLGNALLGALASWFVLEFVEKPAAEGARKNFRIYWNK